MTNIIKTLTHDIIKMNENNDELTQVWEPEKQGNGQNKYIGTSTTYYVLKK